MPPSLHSQEVSGHPENTVVQEVTAPRVLLQLKTFQYLRHRGRNGNMCDPDLYKTRLM
jgi:hypothetical protein